MRLQVPNAWRPYFPLAVYLGAYVATTAIGAIIIMLPGGLRDLSIFLAEAVPLNVQYSVGSPAYVTLLFLPLVLVPLFANIGVALTQYARARHLSVDLPISRAVMWGLLILSIAACLYALWSVGGLFPKYLSGATYQAQMLERARLMSDLGFLFYAGVYAAIPALTALFFATYIKERSAVDLLGFVVGYVACNYLIITLYLKAPIAILFVMLAIVAILARAHVLYLAGLLGLALATFLSLQILIGGASTAAPAPPVATAIPPVVADIPITPNIRTQEDVPVPPPFTTNRYVYAAFIAARGVVFRLGASFPYYVGVFSDPTERCGLESNNLPLLPESACVLPTKIFALMYPNIKWTTGFAPASAHVSAYGELGLGYAVLVMCLTGLSLGVLGAITSLSETPVFVVLNAAVCVYAYFLTQVPLLGALTYAHGLLFFFIPIMAAIAASFVWNRI